MTEPRNKPRDELLERYADAVAQDPRRPSDRVRNAARAHAQMLRDQAAQSQRADGTPPHRPAANQPQWTRSLVASLAIVGLAGLIFVQIDRGNPEDRAIALGTAESEVATSPASTPLPTSAAAPEPKPTVRAESTTRIATAKALPSPPPPTAPAPPTPPARQQQTMAATAPAEADATASAKAVSQAAEQLATAGAGAGAGANDARREASSAEARARMAPAAPAVAAAMPQPTRDAAPSTHATARTMAAQFLAAAREGDAAALQALLAQGVAINTRDPNGNTALMLAVRHRQGPAVRKLLDQGADTALVNKEGMSALRMAEQLGYVDMVQLLHPR